jgi:hypothetical protein
LVVKAQRKSNVADGPRSVAEQVARLVDSHFHDVLRRRKVEVALELAFELAEGQMAH